MLKNDSFYESQINEIRRLRSIINSQDPVRLIDSVFVLLLNIPANVVDHCWPKEVYGPMHDHFKAKYLGICAREGYASPTAILLFFAQLSRENREIFCKELLQLARKNK